MLGTKLHHRQFLGLTSPQLGMARRNCRLRWRDRWTETDRETDRWTETDWGIEIKTFITQEHLKPFPLKEFVHAKLQVKLHKNLCKTS